MSYTSVNTKSEMGTIMSLTVDRRTAQNCNIFKEGERKVVLSSLMLISNHL